MTAPDSTHACANASESTPRRSVRCAAPGRMRRGWGFGVRHSATPELHQVDCTARKCVADESSASGGGFGQCQGTPLRTCPDGCVQLVAIGDTSVPQVDLCEVYFSQIWRRSESLLLRCSGGGSNMGGSGAGGSTPLVPCSTYSTPSCNPATGNCSQMSSNCIYAGCNWSLGTCTTDDFGSSSCEGTCD